MYLDELGQNANLNKILHTLKKVYNVRLDFNVPESELREVYESWTNRKTEILLEDAYNSYHNNPEYAQASLICEAVRIFLSEIGPARKGARVRTKKMQKMGEDHHRKKRADYYLEKISNLVNECNDRNIPVPEENITEIYEMYKVAGDFIDEDIEDENIKRVISQYTDLAKNPKYTAYIAYMIPLNKVEIEVNKFSNSSLSEKNTHTQILHFDNLNDAKEFAMQMKVALSGDYEVGTHIKVNESHLTETENGKEIEPEVKLGKDMHKDAGQDFDGKDQTGDYADDRDPNGDHGYDNYDYAADEDWNADAFVITPEMGDEDESSELKPSDTTYNEKNVVDRYESGPGPSTDGYADDRDPTKIASQDGERSVEDPIDLLAKNKATPGEETKTGLPTDLETGVDADYESGNRKNGVVKNEFNQDPENTEQRDIPKDTDLQNDNNKHYNGGESKAATTTSTTKKTSKESTKEKSEESSKEPESNEPKEDTSNEDKKVGEGLNKRRHALKMIKELNRPRSFNKIAEAAERVANDTNTQLSVVVESYKTEGRNYLETFNSKIEDPVYHEAMLETLNLLTSKNLRHMLNEAQRTQDANRVLFKFLINKAKVNGLRENAVKQFAYAAHNAIMDTDLQSFRPGQPIWEKK